MNFATLQGLTIPEGVITQITDASGRVIWNGRELIQGSMILRPSADVYVGHGLNPADSTAAYLLINEEVSDGGSTYIEVSDRLTVSESKFAMANTTQLEVSKYIISSATIYAKGTTSENKSVDSYYEFILEINGIETSPYRVIDIKSGVTISVPDAIPLINEALAVTGMLPSINIIIESYGGAYDNDNKGTQYDNSTLSQVYVTLGYEGY